ncbi:MAG: hypothetical protein DRJ40_00090 [Thermoprotei archaeon]|nr:MAG: hypothetical protein DRJ40_00090 [Thermoprotei archaeon]
MITALSALATYVLATITTPHTVTTVLIPSLAIAIPLILRDPNLGGVKRPSTALALTLYTLFILVRVLQVMYYKSQGYHSYMLEKTYGSYLLLLVIALYSLNRSVLGLEGISTKKLRSSIVVCSILITVHTTVVLYSVFNMKDLVTYLYLNSSYIPYYLVNSFFEELLFRGFILTALAQRVSEVNAVLIQATLFGIWHVPHHIVGSSAIPCVIHVIFSIEVGTVLGIARLLSNSILIPILLHTFVNSIPILVTASPALELLLYSIAPIASLLLYVLYKSRI